MERSPPSCSWVGTGTVLLTCTLAYCSRSSARCVAGRRLERVPVRDRAWEPARGRRSSITCRTSTMPEPSASRSQDALHPNVLHPLMVGEHVETDVHLVRVAGVVATPGRYLTNGHNSVGTALPTAGHHFRSLSRPEQNGCFSGLGWPTRDDALQPWPKDPGFAKGVGHEASGVATNTSTRMPLRTCALLWPERFSVTSSSFRPVGAGVGSVVMAVLEAEAIVVIAGSWCGPEGYGPGRSRDS